MARRASAGLFRVGMLSQVGAERSEAQQPKQVAPECSRRLVLSAAKPNDKAGAGMLCRLLLHGQAQGYSTAVGLLPEQSGISPTCRNWPRPPARAPAAGRNRTGARECV